MMPAGCSIVNSADDLHFLFSRADSKWLEPCCESHNSADGFLISHCLPIILAEAVQCPNDPPRVLGCVNALARLTAILCQFSRPLSDHCQSESLRLCLNWLHFPSTDSIGFQAVSALANLLELHRSHCGNCSTLIQSGHSQLLDDRCDWPLSVGQALIQNCRREDKQQIGIGSKEPEFVLDKLRAKALQSLLQTFPLLRPKLLTDDFVAALYAQMEQSTLAIQISHLLVDDICASLLSGQPKARPALHLRCIKAQLLSPTTQSRSRESIHKKFLPALMRAPESKSWFLNEFPAFIDFPMSSALSQNALCALLRLAIDQQPNTNWAHLLADQQHKAEQTMRAALNSQSLETRLAAWSLLCSHPRATQPATELDMKLAREFLDANMQLREPAARQTLIAQLERLLSRIREHGRWLLKCSAEDGEEDEEEYGKRQLQLYGQFFRWIYQLTFRWIADPHWHSNLMRSLAEERRRRKSSKGKAENKESERAVESSATEKEEENDEFPVQQNGGHGIGLQNGKIDNEENDEEEEIEDENDENEHVEEEEEEEEGNVPFSARFTALRLLSSLLAFATTACPPASSLTPAPADPFSEHIGFRRWIGPGEWAKLVQALDDRYEVCQELALELLNHFWSSPGHFPALAPLFSASHFGVGEQEWDFLMASPHMPRHQQALDYRLRFLLPRMASKSRMDFMAQLLEIGGKSCSAAETSCAGLSALIRSPQLHATLSALNTLFPFALEDGTNGAYTGSPSLLPSRLLALCHRSAQLISPVVHSMSPEGFLPNSAGAMDGYGEKEFGLVAQQLARTCFRSHKAISCVFAHVVSRLDAPTSSSTWAPDAEQLRQIGSYFWLQLTQCRHRGAFEAAADAFRSVCQQFWAFSVRDPDFPCNPGKWIEQILAALEGREKAEYLRFVVTRRSAGLPHLIGSILATEPGPNSADRFHQTMGQLMDCGQIGDPEMQVHCVNVLRLLFAQTPFAELVLPHVEKAFHISLHGSASPLWPLRNAHTQLFAALVKRVFGTPSLQQRSLHIQSRCKQSAHEFFTRNPSLYPLLLNCLGEVDAALANAQTGSRHLLLAFPLLIVLTHLRPGAQQADQQQQRHSLRPFLPYLLRLLLSIPARALRELASAAILSISTGQDLHRIVGWLCRKTTTKDAKEPATMVGQNFVDGIRILLGHLEELDLKIPSATEGDDLAGKLADFVGKQPSHIPISIMDTDS